MASADLTAVSYAPFAMWELLKAPWVTGLVLNGTTPREASIQENIKESAILHVFQIPVSGTFQDDALTCSLGKSNHPTAGSFVRPSRPSDPPLSFIEALRAKYASEDESELVWTSNPIGTASQEAIEISGKVVEEVGFDKIAKQFAELQELRIVLLDGLRVTGVLSSYEQPESQVLEAAQEIAKSCPNIEELDLSRSLLSNWRHVWDICNPLKGLKKLKVK